MCSMSLWNQGTLDDSYKNHIPPNCNTVNINDVVQDGDKKGAASAHLGSIAGGFYHCPGSISHHRVDGWMDG